MNLHEYQAKQLFEAYGISVPRGQPAATGSETRAKALELGGERWVVKAQVHSGGRGKAGGVVLANSPVEVEQAADRLIGSRLVTHQSGAEGLPVNTVLVEEVGGLERELYLSALVDRGSARVIFMASAEGGMDIEEVAEKTPEKIVREFVHPLAGLQAYEVRKLAKALELSGEQAKQFGKLIKNLYNLFLKCDCSMVEINPLVVTPDGQVLALDAKFGFDDNALFRHPDIVAYRDTDEEDPREVEASKYDLNYIGLDGNIACLVNGAGLAMATMDIIKHCGGDPANFLDVGGGATKEQVSAAFKIILGDPNVKGILVNIFGGIMQCDIIAEGILAAAKETDLNIPLIVRLEGTNVEKGRELIANSELDVITAESLNDAAQKAVAAVGA